MSRLARKPRCWTSGVARTVAPPSVNSAQEIVTRECRPLGRELLIGAILLAGKWCGLLQLSFDRVAAGEQLVERSCWQPDLLNSVYGTGCGPESRSWTVSTPNNRRYPSEPDRRVIQRGLRFGRLALRKPLGAPRSLAVAAEGRRVEWWTFARSEPAAVASLAPSGCRLLLVAWIRLRKYRSQPAFDHDFGRLTPVPTAHARAVVERSGSAVTR